MNHLNNVENLNRIFIIYGFGSLPYFRHAVCGLSNVCSKGQIIRSFRSQLNFPTAKVTSNIVLKCIHLNNTTD